MGRVDGNDLLDYLLHPRWEPGFPPLLLLVGMIVAVAGIAVIVIPAVLRDGEPLPDRIGPSPSLEPDLR